MSDPTPPADKRPYEIEPDPAPPPRKVGDAGLLDDFDEDADFDKDPEVEKAIKGPSAAAKPAAHEEPTYVKPGWGEPQPLALIATGVLLAAVIAAGVTSPGRWWASAASTLYASLLNTVTGVAAVAVAAHLSQMKLGQLPLAAARMFLAVSIFSLIFHLNIPIQGRADEVLLACAAYIGVVWALFRLGGERLFILASIHAGLWLVVWLSAVMHTWAATVPANPAP